MPKLQIKANELVETNADFVSLVKRGASRIPFRITKEDEPMLDLHSIGRRLFKKAEQPAQVVAVITRKGVDLDAMAAAFQKADLDPTIFVKSEDGQVVTLTKADADTEDAVVLQCANDVALVVTGLKKSFDSYSYNSTDFATVLGTEGVYPSMCMAKDALSSVIQNILYTSLSPSDAATKVAAAVDDFKEYIVSVLGNVPIHAFKADLELDQLVKSEVPALSDEPAIEQPAAQEAEELQKAAGHKPKGTETPAEEAMEAEPKKTKAKKDEEPAPAEPAAEVEEDPTAPLPEDAAVQEALEEPAPAEVVKEETKDSGLDPILAAIADLKKSMDDQVSTLRSDVGSLNERVDAVAVQARKAEEAVTGTVFGDAGGDAQPNQVKKSDGPPPLLDTGLRRIA